MEFYRLMRSGYAVALILVLILLAILINSGTDLLTVGWFSIMGMYNLAFALAYHRKVTHPSESQQKNLRSEVSANN